MKFILTFGIFALLFFIWGGYMHESVHQQIYKSYGIESRVEIRFPDLVTIPKKNCEQNTCELAHDINEIVTYNLEMFYLIIFVGFMCIITMMELKMEREEYDRSTFTSIKKR